LESQDLEREENEKGELEGSRRGRGWNKRGGPFGTLIGDRQRWRGFIRKERGIPKKARGTEGLVKKDNLTTRTIVSCLLKELGGKNKKEGMTKGNEKIKRGRGGNRVADNFKGGGEE